MSSRSSRQIPDRVANSTRSNDEQSLQPESTPKSPDATSFSGSRASPEGSTENAGSRKPSSGQLTIMVAAIGAAATITAAALNGMFGLVGSHSTSTVTLSPSSSSASASASPGPSASGTHLATAPLIAGDNSAFVADVTYPDGSKVAVGQRFTKKWEIKNIGTAIWTGRYLIPDGESTGACTYSPRVPIPTTYPGKTVVISVSVTAPTTPQVCYVTWKMANASGNLYFPNEIGIWFNVKIIANSRK